MRSVSQLLTRGTVERQIAGRILRSPISGLSALARSMVANVRLTGRAWPLVVLLGPSQKLIVNRHPSSRILVSNRLIVNSWGGSSLPSSISLGSEALLVIDGAFEIGPNVHLSVADGGELKIGGQKHSSGSGITCDSRVMVERFVSIGADCIIAWGVFISDSDWHSIDGVVRTEPVLIGDRVWVAHNSSILRGASVASGSIVAARSVVNRKHTEERAMLAGAPARVVKTEVSWER